MESAPLRRSQLQVGGERQYDRGHDAERKITEHDRQYPRERPRISLRNVSKRTTTPPRPAIKPCECSYIPAERGNFQRLSALRAHEVVRIRENFPCREPYAIQSGHTRAAIHHLPNSACKIHHTGPRGKGPS